MNTKYIWIVEFFLDSMGHKLVFSRGETLLYWRCERCNRGWSIGVEGDFDIHASGTLLLWAQFGRCDGGTTP